MDEREQKIQQIRTYFEKRDDVVMAFLFGSQAKEAGQRHVHSDWDIGVYFKPEIESVEWEEQGREYPEENKVWGDCVDILKTDEVDIIVLNRAPVSIADAAIKGIPLTVKDKRIYNSFMLIITNEAEGYRKYVHEFYDIYQRSHSLIDRDREDFEKKLNFMSEELSRYSDFNGMTGEEYQGNPRSRNDVERWIEKIIMVTIDISKLILSSQKKLIPDTYRESVTNTAWELSLSTEFPVNFEKWVKLRNVLAHEYLDIKWKKISDFIQNSEPYFQEFLKASEKFLGENKNTNAELRGSLPPV